MWPRCDCKQAATLSESDSLAVFRSVARRNMKSHRDQHGGFGPMIEKVDNRGIHRRLLRRNRPFCYPHSWNRGSQPTQSETIGRANRSMATWQARIDSRSRQRPVRLQNLRSRKHSRMPQPLRRHCKSVKPEESLSLTVRLPLRGGSALVNRSKCSTTISLSV